MGDDSACPVPQPLSDGSEIIVKPFFSTTEEGYLPSALAPFCVYEIPPKSSPDERRFAEAEERLRDLEREGRLRQVDADCMALMPTAEPSKQLWPALAEQFATEVGRPMKLPAMASAGTRLEPESGKRSRLVFLDTQPNGLPGQGRSTHGYGLGHLARALLCPIDLVSDQGPGKDGNREGYERQAQCGEKLESECLAKIEHHLAMPLVQFDPEAPLIELDPTFPLAASLPPGTVSDPHKGGHFGSLRDLGTAIWESVLEWNSGGEKEPLVLNLSLGWNGRLFGGEEKAVEQMPARVQAVYRALEVASCHGALIVAAAGNRAGGPQDGAGPLLPAGWETRPAPHRRQCAKILGTIDSAGEPEGDLGRGDHRQRASDRRGREPLVYAVGGVRAKNALLANSRPESTPPRVAFADHAVAGIGCGEKSATTIMTGTSVASAVVSAAAAGVWSLRPDLSRRELMELLERSGQPLEREPDFRFPGWRKKVHRVVLCRALEKACSRRRCPGWSARCARLEAARHLTAIFEKMRPDYKKKSAPTQKLAASSPLCGAKEIHVDNAVPLDLCPSEQFHGVLIRPWTGPQPLDTPCPSCGIPPPPASAAFPPPSSSNAELYIAIEGWNGAPLEGAVLKVGETLIALGLNPLVNGDAIRITGLDWNLLTGSPPPPVLLSFNTPDGSVEVPVLVVQSATTF